MIVNGQYIPESKEYVNRVTLTYKIVDSDWGCIYVPTTIIGKAKALINIIIHHVRRVINEA